MPRRTLETGPVVAIVGAVLLLISLGLDWFKAKGEEGLSGWTSFEVLDLLLAVIGLATLAAAADRIGRPGPVPQRALPGLGLTALAIVGSQLLNHPPAGVDRAPDLGAWLALGSAALIAAGGLMGLARISVELVVDRGRGRPAEPEAPADAEAEPSPQAEAAAEEPKVQDELYGDERREGPLGADDPEPWRDGAEDETRPIE
jgi:hypothetical protein